MEKLIRRINRDQRLLGEMRAQLEAQFLQWLKSIYIEGIVQITGELSFLDTYTTGVIPHWITRANITLNCQTKGTASQLMLPFETSAGIRYHPEAGSLRELTESLRGTQIFCQLETALKTFCRLHGINSTQNPDLKLIVDHQPDSGGVINANFATVVGFEIFVSGETHL